MMKMRSVVVPVTAVAAPESNLERHHNHEGARYDDQNMRFIV